MASAPTPHWQLPRGVTRGVWEYLQSAAVADEYDTYFALNKLFELDEQIVAHQFRLGESHPPVVADLGCGTGRTLIPLARRGFHGLAIDLSPRMLGIVREKAHRENLPIQCVHANLVELDGLADRCADYAVCLFSTLGMIQGRGNRRQVLQHARRILKPGGIFVLHVHNFWFNLRDPPWPKWALKNIVQSLTSSDIERGDKYFNYRGVHNMFLHVFTRRELTNDLRLAGFRLRQIIPLDPGRHRALKWPWLLGDLRANGWIIVCVNPMKRMTNDE